MYAAELDDDADDNTSERAESADLTPHGRGYQPSIDLARFQKLIESEEKTTSTDTNKETHHKMVRTKRRHKVTETLNSRQREDSTLQEKRHIHSNLPPSSIASSQHVYHQYSSVDQCPRIDKGTPDCLGEIATKQQVSTVREQDDEDSSVTGMSELSSIPPEAEGRVNITIDSEASSVQPPPVQLPVGRGSVSDQPNSLLSVMGSSSNGCQVEVDKRKHLMTSSLPQHPLQVVHRMTPSSHKKTRNEERGTDLDHQDKVHSQLQTLEQVGNFTIYFPCILLCKFFINHLLHVLL